MTKKYTFVANWKMYLSFDESIKYSTTNLETLTQLSEQQSIKIILSPSDPVLYPLIQIFKDTQIDFCAQNCSMHSKGAFTGQTSTQTLRELGCKYCIIGHSEIRQYNKETDDTIARKFDLLVDQKISPIICIGENESEKTANQTLAVLEKQIQQILDLAKIEKNKLNGLPIFIAYEPVWSIGTGMVAGNDYLETVFAWLHNQTQKNLPSVHWNLLYGGSVSPENIESLKKIDYLSGFLIGKSSTNFQEFEKIVKKI